MWILACLPLGCWLGLRLRQWLISNQDLALRIGRPNAIALDVVFVPLSLVSLTLGLLAVPFDSHWSSACVFLGMILVDFFALLVLMAAGHAHRLQISVDGDSDEPEGASLFAEDAEQLTDDDDQDEDGLRQLEA